MARGPEEMSAAVASSLEERTGRSLDGWLEVVAASGIDPLEQNEVRRWLKREHGLGQNSCWAVAHAAATAAGWSPPTLDEQIEAQYDGAKAALRPIFERVRAMLEGLGDDVDVEARASYIPFVRARQFAAVAAATRTRVDVGLRYEEAPESALLGPSTGPGQATHKVSLTSVEEVGPEVEALLRAAYDQNG